MAIASTLGYDDLPALLTRLTGDEKHDWSSLSTLDVLWVLYDRVLRDDDRFLLSKGHGPTAYYAVLAAKGFIPLGLLDGFGTFDSPLGHHPDRILVPGVEIGSGSLGHGLPIAVGRALAGRRVYVLVGDGELDEGSNWEAVQYAGRIGLDTPHGRRDRQRLVHLSLARRHRAAFRARGLGRGARRRTRPRRRRERSRRDRAGPTRLRRGGARGMSMRERFYELAADALWHDRARAVVLADIGPAKIPDHPRRFNVGIREQLMIGVAAGLALEGYRPVVHSYTPFLVERPYEQVKLDLGHQDVGAVLVSYGGSYDASREGRTHQAPEDIAILSALPGWTLQVPGHPAELERMFDARARPRRPHLHPALRRGEPRPGRGATASSSSARPRARSSSPSGRRSARRWRRPPTST